MTAAGGWLAWTPCHGTKGGLGDDPQTSVADVHGELHGTTGVWIGDASGMPTCSGANPMLTVMALAHRTAANMLARAGDRAESTA